MPLTKAILKKKTPTKYRLLFRLSFSNETVFCFFFILDAFASYGERPHHTHCLFSSTPPLLLLLVLSMLKLQLKKMKAQQLQKKTLFYSQLGKQKIIHDKQEEVKKNRFAYRISTRCLLIQNECYIWFRIVYFGAEHKTIRNKKIAGTWASFLRKSKFHQKCLLWFLVFFFFHTFHILCVNSFRSARV